QSPWPSQLSPGGLHLRGPQSVQSVPRGQSGDSSELELSPPSSHMLLSTNSAPVPLSKSPQVSLQPKFSFSTHSGSSSKQPATNTPVSSSSKPKSSHLRSFSPR